MYKTESQKSKLTTPTMKINTMKINTIKILGRLLYIEKILTIQYNSPDTYFLLLFSLLFQLKACGPWIGLRLTRELKPA